MPKIFAATLREHRAETIDRLLDSWGELVMTVGYEGVSLADVAAKAGLARTAIYNYFPDRETLLFAWTHREVQRTLDIFTGQMANAESVSQKLGVFVRLQLEAFQEHHLPPGREVIQFLRPETYGRFREHLEPLQRVLAGILQEGAASGEFSTAEPDKMVPMVMACIGAERIPLATGEHDVEDATERVTSFLLRALGSDGPRRSAKG